MENEREQAHLATVETHGRTQDVVLTFDFDVKNLWPYQSLSQNTKERAHKET